METAKGRQSMNSSPSGTSNNFHSLKKIRKTQFEKDMNALEKDRLCQLLKKDARANSRQFWEAMKAAAVQRYESTDGAFLAFASTSDCMMSLEQFQELCEELGFTLSLSTARSLFDQKLRDWDMRALSLQDFQDACIVAQLDRTRGRMRSHKQNLLACASHIDNFIKRLGHFYDGFPHLPLHLQNLALYTGEDSRRRAVNRFQQKLTPRFCESLWISLQQWAQRRAQLAEATISCDIFLKMVDGIHSFQAYEVEFLSHIYERVDRTRKGEVFLPDLAVAVMLLATNGSRCDKARLIFTVFDTVAWQQTSWCGVMGGDQPSYDADLLLGDELSLAKARRFYEYTAAHPSDALDDDLCTFEEWWCCAHEVAASGQNPRSLQSTGGGLSGICCGLRPSSPETALEIAEEMRVTRTRAKLRRWSRRSLRSGGPSPQRKAASDRPPQGEFQKIPPRSFAFMRPSGFGTLCGESGKQWQHYNLDHQGVPTITTWLCQRWQRRGRSEAPYGLMPLGPLASGNAGATGMTTTATQSRIGRSWCHGMRTRPRSRSAASCAPRRRGRYPSYAGTPGARLARIR
ncbi:unnamed protein product, partial [Symbiodinium sp. CCMP2456]